MELVQKETDKLMGEPFLKRVPTVNGALSVVCKGEKASEARIYRPQAVTILKSLRISRIEVADRASFVWTPTAAALSLWCWDLLLPAPKVPNQIIEWPHQMAVLRVTSRRRVVE